jgi:hypothetical protein
MKICSMKQIGIWHNEVFYTKELCHGKIVVEISFGILSKKAFKELVIKFTCIFVVLYDP